jgi:hypothetical protein
MAKTSNVLAALAACLGLLMGPSAKATTDPVPSPGSNPGCSVSIAFHSGRTYVHVYRPLKYASTPKAEPEFSRYLDRAFYNQRLFTPQEAIVIPEFLLEGGAAATRNDFALQVNSIAQLTTGRYILQYLIRLSLIAGESHGVDASEARDIAGAVFLALLNGRHSFANGMKILPTPASPYASKLPVPMWALEEMQFSVLPSFELLSTLRVNDRDNAQQIEESWILQMTQSLGSFQTFLAGEEIPQNWDGLLFQNLHNLGLIVSPPRKVLDALVFPVGLPNWQDTIVSDWDMTKAWDHRAPVIPIPNNSAAYEYLRDHLDQRIWCEGKELGGLLSLRPSLTPGLLHETQLFVSAFETYARIVRGRRTITRYRPSRN